MKRKAKKIRRISPRRLLAVGVAVVVVAAGLVYMRSGMAASYAVPAEVENAVVAGHVAKVSATGAASSSALRFGTSPTALTFPLIITKTQIRSNRPYPWCSTNQNNCHHNYNAADIMIATGTPVVVAFPGTVTKTTSTSGRSASVTITGEDRRIYFYQHLAPGSLKVSQGQKVVRGTPLGIVGDRAAAFGTDPHLHFDILPPPYTGRVSCSGSACSGYPFINVQPALVEAFQSLPN